MYPTDGLYPDDAPQCVVCGRRYSTQEAAAGIRRCEHCMDGQSLISAASDAVHGGPARDLVYPAGIDEDTVAWAAGDLLSAFLDDECHCNLMISDLPCRHEMAERLARALLGWPVAS
jgi:hypothetical protein